MNIARVERELDRRDASRKDLRRSRSELAAWRERRGISVQGLAAVVRPESALDAEETRLAERLPELWKQQTTYRDWMDQHPDAGRRIDQLSTDIDALDNSMDTAAESWSEAWDLASGSRPSSPVTEVSTWVADALPPGSHSSGCACVTAHI